jgi:MFS transporter, OFA family, oxalate/formate antiporter
VAGFGFGAFVFNFVSTAIVNPNHQEAGDNGYFSPEVANNVPKMIRILCVCWLSLSIVGIAMIFPYEEEKSGEEEKMIENSDDN